MKYKPSFQSMLVLFFFLAAVVAALPAFAAVPGYVYSSDDKTPVRDSDGHCVRTVNGKPYAINECSSESPPAPKAAAAAPASEPKPAPAPVALAVDSDNDGVPDSLDTCPDTPKGAKVDKDGCPLDADRDGVPDHRDKCPGTPAGIKVDAEGCPPDADHDGVPDYLDKCPGTPPNSKVDAEGCVLSITLKVNFDPGKAAVKSQYLPEIEKFAVFLKQNSSMKAEIQGHTDNLGSPRKNKALSEERAKAVREALIGKYGISADRLTANGYGQDNPVTENDTPEGREKNRRVEAVIVK